MREKRPVYSELTELARKKVNARSYVRVYIRRGKITPQPCEGCGDLFAQAHHDDYDKPLDLRWLCLRCHLKHHKQAA